MGYTNNRDDYSYHLATEPPRRTPPIARSQQTGTYTSSSTRPVTVNTLVTNSAYARTTCSFTTQGNTNRGTVQDARAFTYRDPHGQGGNSRY
jgi:hypothetical protein